MNCHWCGEKHDTDQLCQRAQRGMTRRSFCFLFGAGIAGAMLPSAPDNTVWILDAPAELGVTTRLGWAEPLLPALHGTEVVMDLDDLAWAL